MRISTNTIFESGQARMNDLQSGLLKTQQQLSTGRRILTPADDPVASAQALEVTQGQSLNTQFATNRQNVKSSLEQEEGVLQSVTSLLQDVRSTTIVAGGVLDDTQRQFLATELKGRFDELMGLANTRDATGNFLFSGYQTATQPFAQTLTGAQYSGDQGQRSLQVGAARQMTLSDSGDMVFTHATGNGKFTTAASVSNTGSGVISPGTIVNAAALTGHTYSIDFSGGGATYSVFDLVLDPTKVNPPLATGPYVSGQAIAFDGIQLDITDTPANGDTFTVQPSANQSLFTTLTNFINVLNTPAGTSAQGKSSLTNGLNTANLDIDNALDNILTVRASVGARLKEIDSLDSAGEDRGLQFAQKLSELQDVDYTKAITELNQQQTILTAAQQSFVKITNLSVFNYL